MHAIEADLTEAGAVLFLARIISWLKVTFQFGFAVKEQLKVVLLFLQAGRRFTAKFISIGGLAILLDIIRSDDVTIEDRLQVRRWAGPGPSLRRVDPPLHAC